MRQGERSCDWNSGQEAYAKLMRMLGEQKREIHNFESRSSFIPSAYQACITPMAELNGVAIRHVQLENYHRGTYFQFGWIMRPSFMIAIMVFMEDEKGDVVLLQLYKQEVQDARTPEHNVSVGTK